jgi:hypothetical protein
VRFVESPDDLYQKKSEKKLLATIWNKSGYQLIHRFSDSDDSILLIRDTKETSLNKGWFCTDLVPLPDSTQFFLSRTQNAVNLIDVVNNKIYKLVDCPNSVQKFQKMSLVVHDETNLDKVKLSIIIAKENSTLTFENTKDPNIEGIVHNMCDHKQRFKFDRMFGEQDLFQTPAR